MLAVATADAGSAAVGFGPHQFGQPLRHHTYAPVTPTHDAMATKRKPRPCGGPTIAKLDAAMSGAAKTGKVIRNCPPAHATPLPPRKPLQIGKQWPATAALPAMCAPESPARARPALAATAAFTTSATMTP